MWADLDSSSAAKTAPTMKQLMSEEIILFISVVYQRGFHQQGVRYTVCTVAICNNQIDHLRNARWAICNNYIALCNTCRNL